MRHLFAFGALVVASAVAAAPPKAERMPPEREELPAAAARAYEAVRAAFDVQTASAEEVCVWSRRWMEAQRAAGRTPEQDRAAVQAHVARLQVLADKQIIRRDDMARLDYHLTEAEVLLAGLEPKGLDPTRQMLDERRRFQGTWRVQSETLRGKRVEPFTFDRLAVLGRLVTEMQGSTTAWGVLVLEPAGSPKRFRYGGRNDDIVIARNGTYRLADDIWTLTLPEDRVITLVRVKDKPKPN